MSIQKLINGDTGQVFREKINGNLELLLRKQDTHEQAEASHYGELNKRMNAMDTPLAGITNAFSVEDLTDGEYVQCLGQCLNKDQYPELYKKIGHTWTTPVRSPRTTTISNSLSSSTQVRAICSLPDGGFLGFASYDYSSYLWKFNSSGIPDNIENKYISGSMYRQNGCARIGTDVFISVYPKNASQVGYVDKNLEYHNLFTISGQGYWFQLDETHVGLAVVNNNTATISEFRVYTSISQYIPISVLPTATLSFSSSAGNSRGSAFKTATNKYVLCFGLKLLQLDVAASSLSFHTIAGITKYNAVGRSGNNLMIVGDDTRVYMTTDGIVSPSKAILVLDMAKTTGSEQYSYVSTPTIIQAYQYEETVCIIDIQAGQFSPRLYSFDGNTATYMYRDSIPGNFYTCTWNATHGFGMDYNSSSGARYLNTYVVQLLGVGIPLIVDALNTGYRSGWFMKVKEGSV